MMTEAARIFTAHGIGAVVSLGVSAKREALSGVSRGRQKTDCSTTAPDPPRPRPDRAGVSDLKGAGLAHVSSGATYTIRNRYLAISGPLGDPRPSLKAAAAGRLAMERTLPRSDRAAKGPPALSPRRIQAESNRAKIAQ
jgi:hypothetical protein